MNDKTFSTVKIKKAVYISSIGSLFIQFEGNVIAGYDTKEYVNVDKKTATEYKNAEDKDSFYRNEIKGNFKFRYVHESAFDIYLYKNHKPADPFKTYAEYKAEFDRQQELKAQAAFNALNK